jgi:hypothetical protein
VRRISATPPGELDSHTCLPILRKPFSPSILLEKVAELLTLG